MTDRPNVLFLITHDISLRFGCYGDPRAVTPHLDALAARATLFENAFCQFPLCAPARTCLMTGCRPDTVQRHENDGTEFYAGLRRRLPGIRTIPELLRAAGYRTVSLHKVMHEHDADPPSWSEPQWYAATGDVPSWCPDDFDCRERARRYHSAANRALMGERFRALLAAEPDAATQFKRWRGGPVERAPVDDGAYYAGEAAAEAIRVLRAHAADREAAPLFLGVGFCNTHLPWLAPERYWRLHDGTDFGAESGFDTPRPAPLAAELAVAGNEPFQYYEQTDHLPGARAAWQPTPQPGRRAAPRPLRRGQLPRRTDRPHPGRPRRDRAGVRTRWSPSPPTTASPSESTAIGARACPGSRTCACRCCCGLLAATAGQRVTGLTEHVDLMPTLLQLAGVPVPDWAEGSSLLPLLDNPVAPGKPAVFAQARRGGLTAYSTRTADHRYTRSLDVGRPCRGRGALRSPHRSGGDQQPRAARRSHGPLPAPFPRPPRQPLVSRRASALGLGLLR